MGKYLTARSAVSMLVTGAFLLAVPNFHSSVPKSKGGGRTQGPDKTATQKAELIAAAKIKMNRRLSSPALFSRFALEHKVGLLKETMKKIRQQEWDVSQSDLEKAQQQILGVVPQTSKKGGDDESGGNARQANADWNKRPQDETSIAVNPFTGQWVIGANDYGVGVPIGGGVYNSEGVNYFPPFPLLLGFDGPDFFIQEPPLGTGDPALAYGLTRAAPGVPAGVPIAYYASLGFSGTFCENGLFVFRSFDNGATWSRPAVPFFGGLGNVVYHDQVFDCSIFHDKEYTVVDNTGGPHNGRLYVTWTKFEATKQAIDVAYSDDNGRTFSDPLEISGSSATLCPTTFGGYGDAGVCDVDQFSYPTVLPGGTLAVVFENFQAPTAAADGRGQLLVTKVDPDTFAVGGPSKVSAVIDGFNDYPFDSDGEQTLCNSNFRLGASNGNIAVDQNGKLYVTWFDDRAKAGQFPFPTFVAGAPPYQCPGTSTDASVFLSRSTDGGVTWSAPKLVSPKPAGRDQFQPFLASGPGGRVDVVFYDRRLDPGNKLAQTFLARSFNGGGSFQRIQVSDFASNFDNAFFGVGSFIGDYTGIVMDRFGTSYAVWTGVRPGKSDSDVFTRRVPEGDDHNDH